LAWRETRFLEHFDNIGPANENAPTGPDSLQAAVANRLAESGNRYACGWRKKALHCNAERYIFIDFEGIPVHRDSSLLISG
jgi:hypothetical protein